MAASPPNLRTAADLMTANPRTCSSFSTVLEAVMIFRDADCGAVPVIVNGEPAGVLTDRDVALALAEHGESLPSLPVSAIMTPGAISVTPETPLSEVVQKFADKGVRRLLVIDATGMLVGIIAWADVAPHVSDRTIGHVVAEVVEQP